MISPEELFQIDFARLWGVVEEPTRDALLDASAVLRRLLIDESPLIHQANRSTKIKVRFPVSKSSAKVGHDYTKYLFAYINLEPSTDRLEDAELVNLNHFLEIVCFVTEGRALRVKDFIRYMANVAGGVHKGAPRSVEEVSIEGIGAGIPMEQGPLQVILAITRVTLEAMEPIYLGISNQA